MSVPVDLDRVAEEMRKYPFAYLMTSAADGRPHAVAVSPIVDGNHLVVPDAGNTTRANARERPAVALVWPPTGIDEYSLIVDGDAQVDGETVTVSSTRAVLHRPAPVPEGARGSSCGSDCVPLESTPLEGTEV